MIQNKKGIGFFTLIGPFVLVLFIVFMIAAILPAKKIPEKIIFGETVKSIDVINNKVPAQEFYLKESIGKIIDKKKKDYSLSLGLGENYIDRFSNEVDPNDPFMNCRYNSKKLNIWYNEKRFNVLSEKIEVSENMSLNELNCLPNFEGDFEEKMQEYLKSELDKEISIGLKSLNLQEIDVNIDFDESSKESLINVVSTYSESNGVGDVFLRLETTEVIETDLYPQLLITLNKVVKDIQENIKREVFPCLKDEDNSEIYCIEEGFGNMIKKENPQVYNAYKFDLEIFEDESISNDKSKVKDTADKIENDEKTEYYGLKVTVTSKKTGSIEEEFGLILKDNIPYNLVTFSLTNSQIADNIVNVLIDKPRDKIAEQISSYVVLYSYQDFFNKNSYGNFEKLRRMLDENKIPQEFEKLDFADTKGNQYAFSKPGAGLDMNLILINDKSFEEIGEKVAKRVPIYQIYNHETKSYELLDNRPVYVFVFATDRNYNYYVEEIGKETFTKSIIPQTVFGPNPLLFEQNLKVYGNPASLQNSIHFSITGYGDSSFHHYDLYVTQNGVAPTKNCEGQTAGCHYFSGIGLSKEGEFLITSDAPTDEAQKSVYNRIILSEAFTNGLKLENGREYTLYVVPVDGAGNGILNTVTKQYEFVEVEKNTATLDSYYNLESKGTLKLDPGSKKVKVEDKKSPHVMNSIATNGVIINNNNWLTFQNLNAIEQDVIKVKVKYNKFDLNGNNIGNGEDEVSINDGKIIPFDFNIAKLEITKIIPVDKSGNFDLVAYSSSGQTHTAHYP